MQNDLLLTPEDFELLRTPPSHDQRDLAPYLDFLESIEAFASRKAEAKLYAEKFRL
jgi:hypothetical protein